MNVMEKSGWIMKGFGSRNNPKNHRIESTLNPK
jgi:hypothetical protein